MQQWRLNKTEMSAIRSLSVCAITTCLLLALSGFGGDAYSSQPTVPTTAQLQQVIVAHYRAIEENRLDEAMRQYHSQSPKFVETSEKVKFGLSQYLLKTSIAAFCFTGREAGVAFATARHRSLMITGMKLIESQFEVEYQLREENGVWKIWAQRDDSLSDIVKLTRCENKPISLIPHDRL